MSAKKAKKRKKAKKAGKAKKRGEPIDLARVAAGAEEADEERAALAGDEPVEAPGGAQPEAPGEAGRAVPAEDVSDEDLARVKPVAEDETAEEEGEAAAEGGEVGGGEAAEGGEAAGAEATATPAAGARHAVPLQLRAAVEAVVFAADDPVTSAQIAKALGAKPASVRKAVKEIQERLDATASGLALEEIAGGLQFMTREEHAPAIRKLRKSTEGRRLTAPALETLAVVAYKQPVQRQEIEDIRGVSCGPILRTLMERGLLKIAGRAPVLGRPLLYATTRRFLDTFGLGSTKDLPKVGELGPK